MIRQYASAGAVVVTTDINDTRTLLLDQVRATGERQTVAPKGRIEPGESPFATAVREVAEEAGLTEVAFAGYLGQESYRFTDNDGTPAAKTVDWFLLAADDTATTARAAEGFTATRWLTFDQATEVASHPGFVSYLDRAAGILAWRRSAGRPISAVVGSVVRSVADGAQALLDGCPGAGVAVCGSAARGDFVDGWSDIDFIGYGLPTDAPAVEPLAELVRDTAQRYGVHASLHFADVEGRCLQGRGPLYDMKLRAALRRIGTDVVVIAGTAPADTLDPADETEVLKGLTALHDFAIDRLGMSATSATTRRERARRVLSVTCSAARIVALTIGTTTGLRVPLVADLLYQTYPTALIRQLLREYDAFRKDGAHDLDRAEHLAERAPDAIDDLIRQYATSTPRSR